MFLPMKKKSNYIGRMVANRDKTRRERYDDKKRFANINPISLCCVNFQHDGNLGYLIRSAACFGAKFLHVIGSVPHRSTLNALSGSLYDYVEIIQHNTPSAFLSYVRNKKIKLISAEICEDAIPIDTYKFTYNNDICLVVGNESTGVPIEILLNSEKIYIPMPGVGFCLNTSQTANIILYEAVKQYNSHLSSTAEQLLCKQQVVSSNLTDGSIMGCSSTGRTSDC